MASVAIDSMTDSSAHPSDQDSRKRRLLKGPEEFPRCAGGQVNG
jgi:hypothetical protein